MPRGPKKPVHALKSKGAASANEDDGDWLTGPTGKIYIVPKMPRDEDIDAALARIRRMTDHDT